MLQIAIPNKGSLSDDSVKLFREAGYHCRRYGRELMVRDAQNQIDFVFLRPRDIAVYVENGVLDMGITGRDLAADSGAQVTERLALDFGKSKFHYAVPRKSGLQPNAFENLRIATSYPRLVQNDLARRKIQAQVIRLDGAVEISVALGVADLVADVVQTGRTLEEAGLEIVGEPIMQSEAIVIERSTKRVNDPKIQQIVERLHGIVVARGYVMVEYDISEEMLERACTITPGIEAPTIAPLRRPGWVAVKAMAPRQTVNPIMEKLSNLGAKGIIVTAIRTCRM